MRVTIKKLPIIFVSLFLVFLLLEDSTAQTKAFSEARGSGERQAYYEFDKWNFSIGKNRYEIRKNGRAKRTDGRNRVTNFRIGVEDGELSRIIYFYVYQNDLILMSELDFQESGGAFIVRLDGKTLKTKWRRDIFGFNIPKGLVEGNSAYLAAVGYAAKINLDTGKFLWKHDDFYRKYKEDGAFNIFQTPEIKGRVVVLTERKDEYNQPPNVIKFDKMSGKVIEVTVN